MRTVALMPVVLAAMLLSGCSADSGETSDDDEAAPPPTGTATETVTASPMPMRTSDLAVEAAGESDEAQARSGELQDTIPARFHGDWSEDRAQCGTPGHQRYDIEAGQVGFFESRGIVQDVRVNGSYAAATLSEQYGDAPPAVYVFYMAIEDSDTMRIRYDDNPRFRIYRCP